MHKWLSHVVVLIVVSAGIARAQSTTKELAEAGWQAVQKGDADKAAAAFGEALTIHPSDPVLNLGAGAAAHLQGRDPRAIIFLRKSLELEPRLTSASELLGEIAYHEGDLDLAIKTYEHGLVHAPANTAMRQRLDAWRNEAAGQRAYVAMKDDRFTVMFDGPVQETLAARAISVLTESFWRIGKTLGSYPSAPITVILYTDQQFHDATGAPEWAAGGFDGQIRLPVRGASQSLDEFDRVLTHELTHAMLKSIASRNLPVWLNEGLAMYFEGHDSAIAERRLSSAHLFVPLRELQSSFIRLNAMQAHIAYEESAFAAGTLLDRVGPAGITQLLRDLDAGQTMDQAVQNLGFSFGEFETTLERRVNGTTRTAGRR